MLLAIRERITGYIAWFIVILISVPFVLWGVQEYFGLGQETVAIDVNGSEISMTEYDQTMLRNRQLLLQSFNGQIPEYFDADTMLRERSIEQLISRELLRQQLERYNYRIASADLAQLILDDPRFQSSGEFDNEIYNADLQARGLSPQQFEQSRAQQELLTQLQQGLQNTAFAAKSELQMFAKLKFQTRDFDSLKLAFADYQEAVSLDEAAIEAHYAAHPERWLSQERVSVEYIELSLAQLATQISVDDTVLEGLYKDAIAAGRYQTDEIRNASHILINVPATADAEQISAKRQQIEAIHAQLLDGADFAELAKAKSEDPGSAGQGGSLGNVLRGVMVKPFEDALFAMQEGELSEPIQTRFGLHIIKLNKITPGEQRAFADVQQELATDYRNKQAEAVFYDKVDTLATLSFEQPDQLTSAADAIGVAISRSEFFSRDGEGASGVAANAQVRTVAFSDLVLAEGQNSELIEIDNNHVVVLRLYEQQPSRPQTLEEARTAVIAELRRTTAQQQINTAAFELIAAIISAADVSETEYAALGEKYNANFTQHTDIQRDNAQVPKAALQEVFRVPQAAIDANEPLRVDLLNGDIMLLRLHKIKDGDMQWLSAAESQQYQRSIINGRGRDEFGLLLAALKEQAKINMHPDLQP